VSETRVRVDLDYIHCHFPMIFEKATGRKMGGEVRFTDPRDSWKLDAKVCHMLVRWAGQKLRDVHHRWPATWWDAVKERWYPKWALKRWPVKYKSFTFIANLIYPEMLLPREPAIFIQDYSEPKGDTDGKV